MAVLGFNLSRLLEVKPHGAAGLLEVKPHGAAGLLIYGFLFVSKM